MRRKSVFESFGSSSSMFMTTASSRLLIGIIGAAPAIPMPTDANIMSITKPNSVIILLIFFIFT